jgi:hypothetical protein
LIFGVAGGLGIRLTSNDEGGGERGVCGEGGGRKGGVGKVICVGISNNILVYVAR